MVNPLPPVPDEDAPAEPLLSAGTITAAVTAALAALAAFGLDIDDDQQAAILAVVAVAAPIVLAIVGRRLVWSPATVRRALLRDGSPATDAREGNQLPGTLRRPHPGNGG